MYILYQFDLLLFINFYSFKCSLPLNVFSITFIYRKAKMADTDEHAENNDMVNAENIDVIKARNAEKMMW